MKRQEGQTAQPGKRADKMAMLGTVCLSLTPENLRKIVAGEQALIDFGPGRELALTIKQGSKNEFLELAPMFDPSSTRVIVGNCFQEDGDSGSMRSLYDALEFRLTESENSSLGFTVTAKQARVLAAALTSYANAWGACDELKAKALPA